MRDAVREAESIVAGEVSVRASAVRSVSGGEIAISQSAVQQANGEHLEIDQSVLGVATGRTVELDESIAVAVAGQQVEARNIRTVFLIAPKVKGEVRTVFDWKSAIAIGAGIVLTRRLLKLLGMG